MSNDKHKYIITRADILRKRASLPECWISLSIFFVFFFFYLSLAALQRYGSVNRFPYGQNDKNGPCLMSPLLTHATIEYKNVTSHESHSAYNRALHASFVICRNIFIEFWAPNSLPCKFELNAMQYALLICKWNVTCSSQWRWHLHVAFPYWKFKEHHRHKKNTFIYFSFCLFSSLMLSLYTYL